MAEKERPIAKMGGYPVEALLRSDKYANRKDALNVLLDPEKEYSIKEVDKLLSDFMKGEVK